MAIDNDDEILQDFLVEAGELLEQLGEQLVELEQHPQDNELLNAVFRNFHTVKGGAGFLNLDALVGICHVAEDVFNVLRQGERTIDAQLMDVVLRAYDVVIEMVDKVRDGVDPMPANPELIAQLALYATPGNEPIQPVSQGIDATSEAEKLPVSDAAGKEFEAMLDVAAEKNGADKKVSIAVQEAITDDEFEALLDQLQGDKKPAKKVASAIPLSTLNTSKDEITYDEFDKILDEINKNKQQTVPLVEEGVSASTLDKPAMAPSIKEKEVKASTSSAKDSTTSQSQGETTVRVDTKRLDDIMNLVGELVLVRNRLATLRGTMNEEVTKVVGNLDLVTADLQNSVMKTRMQPIKKVFGRFPRVVRDLARSLNKNVTLDMFGEDTDLDKNLVEALADPLVHLVRNSVDHGIELPEVRKLAGKPEGGTVRLSAEQEGDHILLSIEDDGAGMDADVLRRKAVEKGLLDEDTASRMDDRACYNLIFMPGFSTKSEITDISGRGVGMDVVKTRIAQLNGTIEIQSQLGEGSRIDIKVPLTLAIMPTLMVQLGNQIFALPLANVIEIFDSESARTSTVDGKEVVIVRDRAIPMVFLQNILLRQNGIEHESTKSGYVVVVNYGAKHIGCVVDQLIGQEEVVIKPLGSMLQGTQGLAGATITGNGRIALILDMPGLMETYAQYA